MAPLESYRERNELSLNDAALVTFPASLAVVCTSLGSWWFLAAALLAVVTVAAAVRIAARPPLAIAAAQPEIKSGDYPAIAYWAPVLPLAAPPIAAALPAVSLPPELAAPAAGLYYGAALALGASWITGKSYRIGRRRWKRVAASHSVEGITPRAMQAIDSHQKVVAGLSAVGAVDGNTVPAMGLARLTGIPLEELVGQIEKLQGLRLLEVERIGVYSEPRAWAVSLSELGMRCALQLRRR